MERDELTARSNVVAPDLYDVRRGLMIEIVPLKARYRVRLSAPAVLKLQLGRLYCLVPIQPTLSLFTSAEDVKLSVSLRRCSSLRNT